MPASTDESLKFSFSMHGLQQATLRLDSAHWHRGEDAFIAAAEPCRGPRRSTAFLKLGVANTRVSEGRATTASR